MNKIFSRPFPHSVHCSRCPRWADCGEPKNGPPCPPKCASVDAVVGLLEKEEIMDTNQKRLLEISLKELCSIQDDITHMNERGQYGDTFENLKSQRTKLRNGIIEMVENWTCQNAAQLPRGADREHSDALIEDMVDNWDHEADEKIETSNVKRALHERS